MAKAKTKRQRKKLILFLVEGQSEKLALGRAIEKVCQDYYHDEVRVELLLMEDEKQRGGDFTSKYGVKPEKVEELIGKLYFTNFASKYGVYEKDIAEVVHIVDLDGAFIADEKVICDKTMEAHKKTIYRDDCILACCVDEIIERNHRKSENIKKMITMSTVTIKSKKLPYSVYYFSSNLDHYLYGEANLDSDKKCDKAAEFGDWCEEDPELFKESFSNSVLTARGKTYQESWEEAFKGVNSLRRHTNLNLYFEGKMNNNEAQNSEIEQIPELYDSIQKQ